MGTLSGQNQIIRNKNHPSLDVAIKKPQTALVCLARNFTVHRPVCKTRGVMFASKLNPTIASNK